MDGVFPLRNSPAVALKTSCWIAPGTEKVEPPLGANGLTLGCVYCGLLKML